MKRLATLLIVVTVVVSFGAACAAPTPQVIEKEVVVEKPVVQTVVVEKEKVVEVTAAPVDYGSVLFLSTQARPVEEAEKMRGVILADFPGKVDFIPDDEGPFADRVAAEAKAGKGTVDALGALHGNFTTMTDALEDLTPLMAKLADRGIPEAFVELGKLGTDKQFYIPWMQATYIVAANKKALDYLPAGADPEALTWEQYRDWAKNIFEATGEKKVGFPAGEKGLMHRFLEGYIYPSYTGGMVSGFRSTEAVAMWQLMKDMWQYVHPQSVAYEFMQEPLLAEEVWVAFDHTARLINAFKDRPDDFLALPSPSGPKGLGFMPVIAGLAIPKTAPNKAGAEALIEYLTQPEVQITTLREIGFFPVVQTDFPGFVSVGIRMEGDAVSKQAGAPNALPALLPVGLGGRSGEINKIYRDAFTRIVINGEDIQTVVQAEGANLQTLLNETGAPCWPPDPASTGPCQVK